MRPRTAGRATGAPGGGRMRAPRQLAAAVQHLADGAGLHAFTDQVFHPPQLLVARPAVHVTQHDLPHLRVPHGLHHVQRQTGQVEQLKVLGHRLPASRTSGRGVAVQIAEEE